MSLEQASNKVTRVFLVGNYAPDKQISMFRFCEMLSSGFSDAHYRIEAEVIVPPPFLLRTPGLASKPKKYLSYLDKFVFFAPLLIWRASKFDLVHVCDSGNALYKFLLPFTPTLVTCHDLGAIRAAMGEDTSCPPTAFGKLLQRMIKFGLERSEHIACVSEATLLDLRRILSRAGKKDDEVIPSAIESVFVELDEPTKEKRLVRFPDLDRRRPFVLHVGSSHMRKNREAVIKSFAKVKDAFDGQLVFVGEKLNQSLLDLLKEYEVEDRTLELGQVNDEELAALYGSAHVLAFPSYFEGFGWPPLEAQACGCPVISSNRSSLPEILDASAPLVEPDDIADLSLWILRLQDSNERQKWIQSGKTNVKRYSHAAMLYQYKQAYIQFARKS